MRSGAILLTIAGLLVSAGCAGPQDQLVSGHLFTAQGVAILEEAGGDMDRPILDWDSNVEATGYGLPAAGAVGEHEKRLTALDAAWSTAMAALAVKVQGADIKRTAEVKDLRFAGTETQMQVEASLVGVRTVESEYDSSEEIAHVTLRAGLDSEGKVVPDRMLPLLPLSVAARRAQAEEAARYDAVAKLREKIGGAHISQEITVRNLMLSHQRARAVVEGLMDGVSFGEPMWVSPEKCVVEASVKVLPSDLERLRAIANPLPAG
jgi:hypothetical protein